MISDVCFGFGLCFLLESAWVSRLWNLGRDFSELWVPVELHLGSVHLETGA